MYKSVMCEGAEFKDRKLKKESWRNMVRIVCPRQLIPARVFLWSCGWETSILSVKAIVIRFPHLYMQDVWTTYHYSKGQK